MVVQTRSMTRAKQLIQSPEENAKMFTSLNFYSRRNPRQRSARTRALAAVEALYPENEAITQAIQQEDTSSIEESSFQAVSSLRNGFGVMMRTVNRCFSGISNRMQFIVNLVTCIFIACFVFKYLFATQEKIEVVMPRRGFFE